MPRVSKVKLKYDSKYGKEHVIWYTQKNKFEIRDLPDELQRMTDFHPSHYATEEKLKKDAHAACRKYKELKKTERKVILYKCEASTHLLMNKVKDGHYSGTLQGVSKKIRNMNGHPPLATVGITYKICRVVDDGADPTYYVLGEDSEEMISGFPFKKSRHYQEIEYTEERHQFFIEIVESMKELVRKLSAFFGKDPEDAAKLIEQRSEKLLTGNP